jgi:hypothetical protein
MNNRIPWSRAYTGYLILLCSAVTLIPLISGRLPWLVPFGLAGAIFCGVSPRMVGRFYFKAAGVLIGGSFRREEDFEDDFVEGDFKGPAPNLSKRHSPTPGSNREPRGD